MPKPMPKEFWNKVKADYQNGFTQAQICKKYGIKPQTVNNKIKRGGWKLTQEQTAALSKFKTASVELCENYTQATPEQQGEIKDRINTIFEDNAIIRQNRLLANKFQNLLHQKLDSGAYLGFNDIKAGTSAIKDLEYIANPPQNKVSISNQQNQIMQVSKIERVIIDAND